MPWKNRSSIGFMVILLALLGLVLGPAPGLAKVSSQEAPTLISLDVKQMDLQDVLRLIAEKANVNIIAGKEVDGAVTLRLKNVDLWQALESILELSGFGYREEDGIIRVGKLEELVEEKLPLVTEVILLKYAKAEEIKGVCQHLLSSSGTMEIDVQSNALIINDISQNIEKIREVVIKLDTEPLPMLERKRFQLNYLKAEDTNDILGHLIGEEGNFFIDSLANSVYVEAPPSSIKKVKEYFEGADVPPKRIMIKAEFVEVRLEDLKELGIKWRWKGAYEEYPLGSTFRYPHYTRPEPGETVPSRVAPSTLATGMGIIFGSVEQEFRGMIDLLVSEDRANLLSSPSIVTLDSQEARIHVGDRYPYKIKSWKEGELFETTEFIDLGTTLLVTPQIKGEKRVVLDIHPEVKEVTAPERWEGGPPIIGSRDTRTKIEVEDGNSIVIGGLLRDIETEHREGVPFLSRLPIIGSLFTYKKIERKKTDLLVFITPHILPEKLEEENIIEKRKPLKVQVDELYQKGLDYKKLGEYEKAGECFEEVIKKSRMYGFSDYLKYAEKELVKLERLEKERLEEEKKEKARLEKERLEKERLEKRRLEREKKEKERLEKKKVEKKPILGLGLGLWSPSRDNNSFMIYEAQLRLKGSLRLFGGGSKSSDESSYISYFGVRLGDKLNVGVGEMNSSALEKAELMLIGGFSLGTDRVRLEGNYLYVPENEDLNGIRAILAIRF